MKIRYLSPLAAIALASSAFAAPAPFPPNRVHGRAVDAFGATAVAGATVEVLHQGRVLATGRTNAAGEFEIWLKATPDQWRSLGVRITRGILVWSYGPAAPRGSWLDLGEVLLQPGTREIDVPRGLP